MNFRLTGGPEGRTIDGFLSFPTKEAEQMTETQAEAEPPDSATGAAEPPDTF